MPLGKALIEENSYSIVEINNAVQNWAYDLLLFAPLKGSQQQIRLLTY
jgi:hypothetical protein